MSEVDQNKLFVFDAETDNKNDENRGFVASPYYPDNEIVNYCLWEIKIDPDTGEWSHNGGVAHRTQSPHGLDGVFDLTTLPWLFCGHNVRFDFAYWRKALTSGDVEKAIANGDVLLWDTQFAEYLLSGQAVKMPSLNFLAAAYGFEPKLDEVKEMWDAGYKTHEIDPEMLNKYVARDVELTAHIALRQIGTAHEKGMLDFILTQMRSLYVVHEYEWNGMHVDRARLAEIEDWASDVTRDRGISCKVHLHAYLCTSGMEKDIQFKTHGRLDYHSVTEEWFDIDSPDKIKRIIFGGHFYLNDRVEDGVYKSGKKKGETKYKKKKYEGVFPGVVDPETIPVGYLTPKGKDAAKRGEVVTFKEVSLDDNSVDYLLNHVVKDVYIQRMLKSIKEYRDATKLKTTYCKGIDDFLFPDGRIHGNLNVDNTPTGRLTSSNPNMQNIPSKEDSEFKTIFTSRFDEGNIGAVDFKQLEVVGLAYLSQDEQLIDDLRSGRDIHTETAREAGVIGPTGIGHDMRRRIKGINFGTIYGAGLEKLTHQSGLDRHTVKRCIDALKTRYPKAFGREYIEEIKRQLDLYAFELDRDDSGLKRFGNFLVQPTGRHIWFETYFNELYCRIGAQEWPYTCMRNYPVQSIAADIVSVARILFYDEIRALELQDRILMVNEVHDEIVFDINHDEVNDFYNIVSEVESRLTEVLESSYNLEREFDLPLKLEVGVGPNWKEAK